MTRICLSLARVGTEDELPIAQHWKRVLQDPYLPQSSQIMDHEIVNGRIFCIQATFQSNSFPPQLSTKDQGSTSSQPWRLRKSYGEISHVR